jgi:hypothetical protein
MLYPQTLARGYKARSYLDKNHISSQNMEIFFFFFFFLVAEIASELFWSTVLRLPVNVCNYDFFSKTPETILNKFSTTHS